MIGLLIFAGCGDPKVRTHKKIPDGMQVKKAQFGSRTTHTPFKNGKIHGTRVVYYDNGIKAKSTHYINGKREGEHRVWSRDGEKMLLHYFKNNELDGTTKNWHFNGTLSGTSSTYTDGSLTGTSKGYYNNGKLRKIVHYVDHRQNGLEKHYDDRGRLTLTIAWVNGVKKGTTLSALEKRNVAAIEKEYQEILASKKKRESSSGASSASLACSGDNSHPSMSEYNRKIAVARGQGEGAALGGQMKSGSISANSYCIQNANASGLACPYAQAYLAGCMSKFGY